MALVTQSKTGMRIERLFTAKLKSADGQIDPLDTVEWSVRDSKIAGTSGTVFEMRGVTAPAAWSQLAVDIAVSKYFRKAGVPLQTKRTTTGEPHTGTEVSVRQLVQRVALAIRRAGERQSYFATPNDADVFEDELKHLLVTQSAAFNSPVWFNCGLAEAYGITGEAAGNHRWEPTDDTIQPTQDSYTSPQVSACFIQKIEDDLMDIAEHVRREMRIFKYGSGAGANFSTLRAKGETLSNGGSSSGMMSFLEIFDRAAGAIKSGGTTRRAAKMVCVDVNHPDIEDFITWKVREEDKIRALVAGGFEGGMNGEAARTVSGQNANNSVRVDDAFMQAVMDDGEYDTIWRTTGEVAETKKARQVMRKIAVAAHTCADPGMQYSSTINRWHTCKESGPINASNPCSEYVFLDDSACNLASLNLVKFDSGEAFDYEAFEHAVRIIFMAQEILVDHASYPSFETARNSHDYRPLGIGYANLGAMLMRRGLAYDSAEGRQLAASITSLMTGVAYETSADMAAVKGAFGGFARNRDSMLEVIEHHEACSVKGALDANTVVFDRARAAWARAITKGRKHGFRNAQASLLAPTGTIGLLMDCDTTGVEPDFALVKHKKLAGGGSMDIINQSVAPALSRLGYTAEQCDVIVRYLRDHKKIEGAPGLRDEHLPVFDCATVCGDGVRSIAPTGHIGMMAAVQPFLSGAISKTVNVPEDSTVEDIEALYVAAWAQGVKALAIYRDNSKSCQVLSGGAEASAASVGESRPRARLPKKRRGFTQEARVGGQKLYVRTGEYEDGSLGEVFIDMHKEGATMRSMTNCFAISMSLGLQHGVPLEQFVDAFTFANFAPNGVVQDHPNIKHASSIIDYIMRVLAFEYLGRTDLVQVKPDGVVDQVQVPVSRTTIVADAHTCTVCGNLATRKNGTCYICDNCGTQTGCA